MKTKRIDQQLQGDSNPEIECMRSRVSFMKIAIKKLCVQYMHRNYRWWSNSALSRHSQQTELRKRMNNYLRQLNGSGDALPASRPIGLANTPG